jgi:hypothetical protein
MNKITSIFLMRKAIFLSAIFFLTLLFSCKKDGELTPDFDNDNLSINFTDTFSLVTSVVEEDSIRTDLSIYNILGLYHDPIFGPVSSSIYANVALSGTNTDFGAGVSIDSVVLTLDYQGLYGDTSSLLSINVYELNAPLDEATDYYSNMYSSSQSVLLGSSTFLPNIVDSVWTAVDSTMHKPHLRIKLIDPTFITNLENGSPYIDDAAFSSVFKGLYITNTDSSIYTTTIPSNTGALAYFNLNSSLSTVTVYYNNSASDSLQESFKINSETVKYCRFAHNYANTDVIKHIAPVDPSHDPTVSYVSAMAGVKTKIEIPNIKELAQNGNIIINKAELVITIENPVVTEGDFNSPLPSLALVGINSNFESVFLPDYYEGPDYFGGVLNTTYKTYRFNIARHIHQLAYSTEIDNGMYLIANSASILANRSVISSENSSISKIKLEITYSKL